MEGGDRISFDLGKNNHRSHHTSVKQKIQQFERNNSRSSTNLNASSSSHNLNYGRRSQVLQHNQRASKRNEYEMRMTEGKAQEMEGPFSFELGEQQNSSDNSPNSSVTMSVDVTSHEDNQTSQQRSHDMISIEFKEVDISVETPVSPSSPRSRNQEKDLFKPSILKSKGTVLTDDTEQTSLSSLSSLEDEGPDEEEPLERKKSIRWADDLERWEDIPLHDNEQQIIVKELELHDQDEYLHNRKKKNRSFWSMFLCASNDAIVIQ